MAVVKLGVDGVTFKELWDANVEDVRKKCFRTFKIPGDSSSGPGDGWGNYCAIRLSERFIQNDLLMPSKKNSPYKQCNSHPQDGDNAYHFLEAEQMASWLLGMPIPGMGPREKIVPKEYVKKLDGRTGIIFFKDYWRRRGEKRIEGDHIDIWNGSKASDSSSQWLRELSEWFGNSDRQSSSEIWFWEVE